MDRFGNLLFQESYVSGKTRTHVYVVRHGETELNQNTPGYCGWTDIPLNDKGRAQAQALGRRFEVEHLAAVLASDLERARHTAEAIAWKHDGISVHVDERFRELNYGAWEGISAERLMDEDRERFLRWKADPLSVPTPNGETLIQVVDRSVTALNEWVARYRGQTVVLVAHKSTVRLLLCWAMGLPLSSYVRILQQNAAVNRIDLEGGHTVVGLVNDTCHLPGDLCSPAM
jgi:broad specificity phosphatase PhoE